MAQEGKSMLWRTLLALLSLMAACLTARPASASSRTTPWDATVAIAAGLPGAAHPSLVYTSDRTEHVAWESEGEILYSYQAPDGPWSAPTRIAYGSAPSLVVGSDGRLHAVFVNQFLGNYEIYHILLKDSAWTLPVNISNTSGISSEPAIAAAPDGLLYAAWSDTSPGYEVIYYGVWNGEFWANRPVDHARGKAPALAVSVDGSIYLAWQDRIPTPDNPTGVTDILVSQLSAKGWSPPLDVSHSVSADSIGVRLATTPDGLAQLVWMEGDETVRYCYGRDDYWPWPQNVAQVANLARGPQIAVARDSMVYIAWDEGELVRATAATPAPPAWPKADVLDTPPGNLREVVLAANPNGGATLVWIQAFEPGNTGVYESSKGYVPTWRSRLPLVAP